VLGRPYLTAWQPGECAGGLGAGTGDTHLSAQYRCRMRGSATAGAPRSRRLAIIAANPRGAVYGTIVATAVIAASAGHQTPGLVLAATVATLLVFWLAHVYSDFLDHGVRHAGFDLKILPGIMARELSMLAAPALSILFCCWGRSGCSTRSSRSAWRCGTACCSCSGGVSAWDASAGRHGRGGAHRAAQRRLWGGDHPPRGAAALTSGG
jgi:hypothetical protein